MIYELSINIFSNEVKAFIQDGFFQYRKTTNVFHKHIYAEIHAVANGNAEYVVENKWHSLEKGDILLIGKDTFHKCEKKTDNFCLVPFQIRCDMPLKSGVYKIEPTIIQNLINEIEEYAQTAEPTKVKAYLTLICSKLFVPPKCKFTPSCDRELIIYEYFALNYCRDANINELAESLGVCSKQASRLVKKYTGNDFRTELAARRIFAAKQLMNNSAMSLSEIAQQVGYRSYNGFWKAYRKYRL